MELCPRPACALVVLGLCPSAPRQKKCEAGMCGAVTSSTTCRRVRSCSSVLPRRAEGGGGGELPPGWRATRAFARSAESGGGGAPGGGGADSGRPRRRRRRAQRVNRRRQPPPRAMTRSLFGFSRLAQPRERGGVEPPLSFEAFVGSEPRQFQPASTWR